MLKCGLKMFPALIGSQMICDLRASTQVQANFIFLGRQANHRIKCEVCRDFIVKFPVICRAKGAKHC